ncbi:MAG TPA: T9SS type A sorting domain-containing protein, partial [Cytophagales bacterium]|nr:T9SS type A sorting domain-containing protein [Cytophagales bacterium]
TTLTMLPRPAGYNAYGYSYFEFGSKLYLQYSTQTNAYHLMRLEGDQLIQVPNPIGHDADGSGFIGQPILYNSKMYMKYKGNDGNTDLATFCNNDCFATALDEEVMVENEVYPNPSNNVLRIDLKAELETIDIYDGSGRSLAVQIINKKPLLLDLSGYEEGVYLLRLKYGGLSRTLKLIKK